MLVAFGAASGAVLVGLLLLLERDEQLARIPVRTRHVVRIYAEGAFFYEPPGYIYCEITTDGRIVVPRRRFMGIGSERKPHGTFQVASTDDGQLLAIARHGDVRFIYDTKTQESWPGLYTNTNEDNYRFAKSALKRLAVDNEELRCHALRRYESQKDREARSSPVR